MPEPVGIVLLKALPKLFHFYGRALAAHGVAHSGYQTNRYRTASAAHGVARIGGVACIGGARCGAQGGARERSG